MPFSREQLKIIGHRGWPARFPDNSLAGITAAAEVADMVEVDIRLTADGKLVLSHDSELGGHAVADSEWDQLAGIDIGRGHHPVLLVDLLPRVAKLPLNLEIKNFPGDGGYDPTHLVGLKTATLARPGDLITSFNWPTVDVIREAHPELATGLLVDVGWSLEDAAEHARERGHQAVVPNWELAVDAIETVGKAARSGLTVAVWTLNDPAVVIELAEAGVSAIITDDPGMMRRALFED